MKRMCLGTTGRSTSGRISLILGRGLVGTHSNVRPHKVPSLKLPAPHHRKEQIFELQWAPNFPTYAGG
jgi:hypothetical protein